MINYVNDFSENSTIIDKKIPKSQIPKVAGGNITVVYNPENFRTKYIDEYTGEPLDQSLITEAIIEELNYFNSKVWKLENKADMLKKAEHIFVRSRWVLCNKGDHKQPDMRARLVACEINRGDRHDAFFASTPPLEAKKVLFSRLAQEQKRDGVALSLDFLDVKKAYFNGIPKRDVYMQLPRELGLPSHFVAKQVRCVYGTRDAGAIWEDTYRAAFEGAGFVSGVASPCCFFHPQKGLSVVVHGDDITTLGKDVDLDWLWERLSKSFELKFRGRIGVGKSGSNDMRILNRVVEIHKDGVHYEADPRHVDLLTNSLGLTNANSVLTPGIKEHVADYETVKVNESQHCPKVNAELDDNGGIADSVNRLTDSDFIDGPLANSVRSATNGRKPNLSNPSSLSHVATHKRKSVNLSGSLHDETQFFHVPAYSEIYGVHPSTIAATDKGFKFVSSRADAFTSKLGSVMLARVARRSQLQDLVHIQNDRATIIGHQHL